MNAPITLTWLDAEDLDEASSSYKENNLGVYCRVESPGERDDSCTWIVSFHIKNTKIGLVADGYAPNFREAKLVCGEWVNRLIHLARLEAGTLTAS